MKVFDSFTFNANSKNADRNLYLECLLDTLTDKLESITKFEAGKTYQSESFSLAEFLIGYEGLMQSIHCDELGPGQLPTRKPFEGASFKDIAAAVDGARQNLRDFAEKFKIEDLNPEVKATSAKSAKELFADKQVTNHITNGIVEIASKGNVLSYVNKNAVTASWKSSSMFVVTAAAEIINDMWKRFEKTNDPAEKEKIIEKGAIDVFKNVRTRMGFFRLEDKSTFIAAQRVTDLLLKTYSPIASDETYAKYANNYFITNKGPAETTGRDLKVAPEIHLENLKEQLPLWNEIRAELGIDGPAPLPSVEEIKKSDEILIEEKRKAEEEKARKDAEDKAAAEETAAKKKEFIEKNKAKEGQADAPAVDDKKVKISIPALSENINKTETSPKVKENEVPTTQNVKNP